MGVESWTHVEIEHFQTFEPDASKSNKHRAYLYYCGLCDEALAFSEAALNPSKIRLVYDDNCPGCGFDLERVLCSESYDVPGANSFFNGKIRKPDSRAVSRTADGGGLRTQSFSLDITTGSETVDRVLGPGRLIVLAGPTGHALSFLLCVKAQLLEPLGPDSHVVWVDGGNVFDPKEISSYAADHQIGLDKVQKRIRLSRAFTYHQLSTLITRMLPLEMDRFRARVAVVSDMTQLYCDPDTRNEGDALGTFKRDVRFIRELVVRKSVLVVATVLRPRNRVMDSFLLNASLS